MPAEDVNGKLLAMVDGGTDVQCNGDIDGRRDMGMHLYRNRDSRMGILRCIGPDAFFQEKVLFPFEAWLFSCPADSRLDIWSTGPAGPACVDSIAVAALRPHVETDSSAALS